MVSLRYLLIFTISPNASFSTKTLLIFPHGLHCASFITILKIALEHLLECQWEFSYWGFWNNPTFCRQNRSESKATPFLPQINQKRSCQCFQFCFWSPEDSAGSAACHPFPLSLMPPAKVCFFCTHQTLTPQSYWCGLLKPVPFFTYIKVTVCLCLQDCSQWNYLRSKDRAGEFFLKALLWGK